MSEELTELDKLGIDIRHELEKWQVLGVSPDDWKPQGAFIALLIRLDVLTEFVKKTGLFDEDEANLLTAKFTLERLEGTRKEIEPIVQQMKLNAIKAGKFNGPGMH